LNTPRDLFLGLILNLPSVISGMDNQGFEFWRQKETFHLFQKSRPTLGPTQSPTQWVPGSFPQGWRGQVVTLTTHLHLILGLKMSGAILLLPHYAFMVWKGSYLI